MCIFLCIMQHKFVSRSLSRTPFQIFFKFPSQKVFTLLIGCQMRLRPPPLPPLLLPAPANAKFKSILCLQGMLALAGGIYERLDSLSNLFIPVGFRLGRPSALLLLFSPLQARTLLTLPPASTSTFPGFNRQCCCCCHYWRCCLLLEQECVGESFLQFWNDQYQISGKVAFSGEKVKVTC